VFTAMPRSVHVSKSRILWDVCTRTRLCGLTSLITALGEGKALFQ